MIPTDIAAYDSNPQRVFTGDDGYTGPVLADITCPDGIVRVTVDPAARVANVRVRTDDPTSPAATAVKNTRIHQTAERLTVVVPPIPPTTQRGGGVFVGGNSYSYSKIVVNGVTISGGNTAVINGMNGVEVLVTLPAGSGVKSASENGSLHVHGVLAALDATATNGSITAETVGRVQAEAANGSVRIGTVTEWIDAESSNGSVKVDNYAGQAARIRSGNGSVALAVAAAATGQITAKAGNGSVKLYGVRHRTDLDVRASAGNGTVKKF